MTSNAPDGGRFVLDRFQVEAIAAIDSGASVLVAAPTGSGKTVVAEAAIERAIAGGRRAFYTTPIKALSNQKFLDFGRSLGRDQVGLLTGDNSIRGDAPVVVMTTEVLRNMIYAESEALDDLAVVVLDEVHYLQDASRGPVWEEVIIHLREGVQLVCLSATVSNSAELGDWIETVRGTTATIVETERPVELENLYLVSDRAASTDHLVPVLVDGEPNPDGAAFDSDPRLGRQRGGGRSRSRYGTPRRVEAVERLAEEELLPAIYFIFSRNACDDALAACRDAGVRLTNRAERVEIRSIVEQHVERLNDDDLDVLSYDLWLAALEQGIANHHAGMVPPFREAVEACFVRGLVKVVFATETLALGINMPARAVVIEKLSKYNGETHELLRPGEYTQLTGRAGRRGIDDHGVAIVAWSPFVPFQQVAMLVSSRDFPLRSSFRPTYNMVANLVERYDRETTFEVLGQSFAQFQADRALVAQQRRLADDRRAREQLATAAHCELGDVEEYAALVGTPNRKARRADRERVNQSMALLRPGDVVRLPAANSLVDDMALGAEPFDAVVLSVANRGKGVVRVDAVDRAAGRHRLDSRDLQLPLRAVGEIELPVPFAPNDPDYVADCASLLGERPPVEHERIGEKERRRMEGIASHPVHACPVRVRHLEATVDLRRLDADIDRRKAQLLKASGSLAHRVESVIDLLVSVGMLEGWSLTATGRRLARIAHESDLALALAIDRGVLDGLEPADLAALLSCLTYEERRADAPVPSPPPGVDLRRAVAALDRTIAEVRRAERHRGLPLTREIDVGFSRVLRAWASGRSFEQVLDADLSGGDFVRNVKVLIDLLRQVESVASESETRRSAGQAVELLRRGVVAASSEVGDIEPSTP